MVDPQKLLYTDQTTYQCPHCGVLSLHFLEESRRKLGGYNETITFKGTGDQNYTKDVYLQHFIYQCINCKKDTYFLIQHGVEVYGHDGITLAGELAKVIHQFPLTTPTIHPSVPKNVREATLEAEKCLSAGAYNACGVMARRAIHALCQDKGAEGKDLYHQLEFLRNNHLITPDLWEWAEELRIAGRSGAHPEWEVISPDDADYTVRIPKRDYQIHLHKSIRAE